MDTMALAGFSGVFGDRVYSAKDLTRRTAEVLDQVQKAPVTISRKQEQYAILKREQAAGLIRSTLKIIPIIELLEGALSAAEQKDPPRALAWLRAFDQDDLRKLVREVLTASDAALRGVADWDTVDAIVHEWHESALVIMSGTLAEAKSSPADEVPLPDPRAIAEAVNEVASKR
jgi:hypothetical protein